MTPPVERCLGLDLGEKRIGVAVSDQLWCIASPLSSLARVGPKKDLVRIRSIIEEFSVGRVVVGLPVSMDGSFGEAATRTLEFVERLRAALSVPVETWDERLTTRAAERALLEADVRRDRRRELVDGIAASLILQGYLDYRNSGGSPR